MVRGTMLCLGLTALLFAAAVLQADPAEAGCGSEVPPVDCVSVITDYHSTLGEVAAQGGMQLLANGSALMWYTTYDLPDDSLLTDHNESWWVQPEAGLLDDVVACMTSEGFWTMEESYANARQTVTFPPASELTASWPDGSRSVVFEDYTMIGLMPETSLVMDRVMWPDITVDVTVAEVSPFMYEVSCVMRNGMDVDFSFTGVTKDFWHMVVVRENGCTFKPMDTVSATVFDTLAPGEELVFDPILLNASGYPDGDYFVLAPITSMNGIGTFTVEGNDDYINTPPLDRGNEISRDGDVITIELLRCCDSEDRVEDILVRWDWESDGAWDTDWSSDKSMTRAFEDPDHINVTYELKDSDGAVTVGSASYSVERNEQVVLGLSLTGLVVVSAIVFVVVLALILVRLSKKSIPGR